MVSFFIGAIRASLIGNSRGISWEPCLPASREVSGLFCDFSVGSASYLPLNELLLALTLDSLVDLLVE